MIQKHRWTHNGPAKSVKTFLNQNFEQYLAILLSASSVFVTTVL